MGRRWLRGGVFSDEALRGQSHSRRYSEAGIQDPPVETRRARAIDIRRAAFGLGVVVSAEMGLRKSEIGKSQLSIRIFLKDNAVLGIVERDPKTRQNAGAELAADFFTGSAAD